MKKAPSLVLAVLILSGCSAAPPTEKPDPATSLAVCVVTMDHIAEVNQPDAAEAWAAKSPDMCAFMLEEMGEADFIDMWTNRGAVELFIAEQTGGKG